MCDFVDCMDDAINVLGQEGVPVCKLCQLHTDEVEVKLATGKFDLQLYRAVHTTVQLAAKGEDESWRTVARSNIVH